MHGCGILKHPSLILKQSIVISQLSGQSQGEDLIGQNPVQCNISDKYFWLTLQTKNNCIDLVSIAAKSKLSMFQNTSI